MSDEKREVQRWSLYRGDCNNCEAVMLSDESPRDFVQATDYAALEKECAELRAELADQKKLTQVARDAGDKRNDELRAENERISADLDILTLQVAERDKQNEALQTLLDAAREGK